MYRQRNFIDVFVPRLRIPSPSSEVTCGRVDDESGRVVVDRGRTDFVSGRVADGKMDKWTLRVDEWTLRVDESTSRMDEWTSREDK